MVLVACGGCDDKNDPQLLLGVSVTTALFVDSGLSAQSTTDPERRQAAAWSIDEATLAQGGSVVDLRFQENCDYFQSTRFGAFGDGKCASGVVVNAAESSSHVLLSPVRFRMQVARARPVELPPGGDFDLDGVPNDADNCPLVDNLDQADSDGDGTGNACVLASGVSTPLPDADGDGITDSSDNCLWFANASQADTTGVTSQIELLDGSLGLPDGIGDACTQQVAQVLSSAGSPDLTLSGLALDIPTPLSAATLLVLDFGDALECDWPAGTCRLIESRVEFCAQTNITLARFGCS